MVERRTKLLKESGIKFVKNFEIGKNLSLDELRKKHDVVLISVGVYKPREVIIPGNNLVDIFPAMTFLTASKRKGLGDNVKDFDNGKLNSENKIMVSFAIRSFPIIIILLIFAAILILIKNV